jgi:hypothetical protein
MAPESNPLFHEEQIFRQLRLRLLTAIPPVTMSLLAIWQVGLGHVWGKNPMSNAGIVGWTIFLWLIYLRLLTVRLVTEVRPGEVRVSMRGLWRSSRIYLSTVRSVDMVTYDAARDWGGYGIRSNQRGRAYIAGGSQGVKLNLADGNMVLIGSGRSRALAGILGQTIAQRAVQ